MRTLTTLAAAALLSLASGAYAQTQEPATPEQQTPPAATQPAPTQAPAATEPAQTQTQAPAITSVQVVDLSELTAEEQSRVTEATAKASEADIQSLRNSIALNAQASAALQAEGIGTEAVIAAAIAPDGTLTLITRKS
jgi:hypothetical protein